VTIIDLLLVGGLGFAVYRGYQSGAAKKVFNVLALVGSIVLAAKLMHRIGGFFIDVLLLSPLWGYIFGFASVVVAVMLLTIYLFNRFGRTGMANSSSQFFGVLFGLLEGAIVISLVLLMLRLFGTPDRATRTESFLYRPLANFVPTMFDALQSYLPGASSFRSELSTTFEQYDIFDQTPDAGKGS
jgi:uncharacterized membrane protein required for colicin V production